MMKKLSEGEALDRLLKIDWQSDSAFDKSNATFMREYFRRMRNWYLILKPATLPKPQWWAFFDVAAVINPSVRADAEIINRLHQELHLSPVASRVCEWYLHWTALVDTIDVQVYKLEAPCEPAIHILERGCEFMYRGGYLDVCVNSWMITNPDAYNRTKPFILVGDETTRDD